MSKDQGFSKNDTLMVKGLAIIMMMIHHCYLSTDRYEGYYINFYPFSESQANKIASYFKICVAVFVFLTAYGLTISCMKKASSFADRGKDAFNRAVKLWSNYILIFVVFHIFGIINTLTKITPMKWDFFEAYGGLNVKSLCYFFVDALGLSDIYQSPTFNGTWWYMSLAYVLIFLVPILVFVYEKFGIAVVILSGLLPRYLRLNTTNVGRYLLVVMVGIWMAEEDIFSKIKNSVCTENFLRKAALLAANLALIIVSIYTRNFISGDFCAQYVEVFDCFAALLFILLTFLFLSKIPVLRDMLRILGEHSMNIFMLHTFYRAYYLKGIVYHSKYALVNVAVLLAISWVTSVLIEKIKKMIGYPGLVQRITLRKR